MILLSLVLNLLVLVPVTASLIADARWTRSAYGERTSARGILSAIYLAFLAASAGLLLGMLLAPAVWMLGAAVALLAVQIVYKALTVVTVRSPFRNPVVLSNLGIAAVHLVTVITVIPLLNGGVLATNIIW